eukprot:TRINITY_DN3146_c0_g1_i6.p2 TRINITY_DN3146_c0_g1~~TRINITY_DN3146_c0_g1_i6.p2  ORF type:complete len:169 (+),score=55.83 TRINITY_DN3146_c0_g1_i6:187-693(+)
MRYLLTKEEITVPEGVEVAAKARVVTVGGTRGKLQKSFKHVAVDIYVVTVKGVKKVVVEMWFGNYKIKPVVRSVASAIQNMIDGVTKGHRYKMRAAFAHFPINMTVLNKGKALEIRNFVGEKHIKKITMLPGCEVRETDNRHQIIIEGIDLDSVALTCIVGLSVRRYY